MKNTDLYMLGYYRAVRDNAAGVKRLRTAEDEFGEDYDRGYEFGLTEHLYPNVDFSILDQYGTMEVK